MSIIIHCKPCYETTNIVFLVKRKGTSHLCHPLRQLEIGLWRQTPLVEIYDLPSHGRQIYRRHWDFSPVTGHLSLPVFDAPGY